MANHRDAEKRTRQNEVRRERNRNRKSTMRTAIKRVRTALDAGETETAQAELPKALKTIDKTAQKGAIHRNTAARTKSRLTRAVQSAS